MVALRLLDWDKVEDIVSDGGIVKKITSRGKDWATPNEGATCVVTYEVKDGSGKVVEAKQHYEFIVDEGLNGHDDC